MEIITLQVTHKFIIIDAPCPVKSWPLNIFWFFFLKNKGRFLILVNKFNIPPNARLFLLSYLKTFMIINCVRTNGHSCNSKFICLIVNLALSSRFPYKLVLCWNLPSWSRFLCVSLLLLASFGNMRIHNSLLPFMIFLIILSMVHLSYCRQLSHASPATYQESEQQSKSKSSLQFKQRFVAVSRLVELEGRKVKPEYDVSHQVVPCGPNPLHN